MELKDLIDMKTTLYSLITLMKLGTEGLSLEIMDATKCNRIAIIDKDYVDIVGYELNSAELIGWGIGENKIIAWIKLEEKANE